jgi:hypothetical protein
VGGKGQQWQHWSLTLLVQGPEALGGWGGAAEAKLATSSRISRTLNKPKNLYKFIFFLYLHKDKWENCPFCPHISCSFAGITLHEPWTKQLFQTWIFFLYLHKDKWENCSFCPHISCGVAGITFHVKILTEVPIGENVTVNTLTSLRFRPLFQCINHQRTWF